LLAEASLRMVPCMSSTISRGERGEPLGDLGGDCGDLSWDCVCGPTDSPAACMWLSSESWSAGRNDGVSADADGASTSIMVAVSGRRRPRICLIGVQLNRPAWLRVFFSTCSSPAPPAHGRDMRTQIKLAIATTTTRTRMITIKNVSPDLPAVESALEMVTPAPSTVVGIGGAKGDGGGESGGTGGNGGGG